MVLKKSGKIEPFSRGKIVKACMGAGATQKIAKKIADEIAKASIDKSLSTNEIRATVLRKLKKENPAWEAAYLAHEKVKKK